MIILKVLSDLTMVFDTILFINALKISILRNKRSQFAALLIVSVVLSSIIELSYVYDFSAISVLLYPLMFIQAYYIVFGKIKISQIYLALISDYVTTILASCSAIIISQISSISYSDLNAVSLFIIRILFLLVTIVINLKKVSDNTYIILSV